MTADWQVPSQGTSGHGTASQLTGDSGYFWFFNAINIEVVVKVLDGCGIGDALLGVRGWPDERRR